MTLDEAIAHAEDKAKEQDKHAENMRKRYGEHVAGYRMHCDCAAEHRQLAEWLKELKRYREADKKGFDYENYNKDTYRKYNL